MVRTSLHADQNNMTYITSVLQFYVRRLSRKEDLPVNRVSRLFQYA